MYTWETLYDMLVHSFRYSESLDIIVVAKSEIKWIPFGTKSFRQFHPNWWCLVLKMTDTVLMKKRRTSWQQRRRIPDYLCTTEKTMASTLSFDEECSDIVRVSRSESYTLFWETKCDTFHSFPTTKNAGQWVRVSTENQQGMRLWTSLSKLLKKEY